MKGTKKTLARVLALVLVFACLPFNGTTVKAATAEPAYEVKYVLDESKVLDSNHDLIYNYARLFQVVDQGPVQVEYIDNSSKAFNNAGWANRVRLKSDAKKYELTYKKRYPITTTLDAALAEAAADGFTVGMADWEAEVDWGYTKKTLSFSYEVKTKTNFTAGQLPSKSDATSLIKSNMPTIEKNYNGTNWGKNALSSSKCLGPITYKKYKGTYAGVDVTIEIWPITNQKTKKTEYLVELSYKAENFTEADAHQSDIQKKLQKLGIFKPVDSLKTNKVYDAYY